MRSNTHQKGDIVEIKNNLKKVARKTGSHLNRNKVAYAASAVAIAAIVLQQRNNNSFQSFLLEKGIDPMEFYMPDFAAELAS